jgi:hypothetical protein
MALISSSSSFGPLPSADFDKWMEIEPGQTKKFTIGNVFGTSTMHGSFSTASTRWPSSTRGTTSGRRRSPSVPRGDPER